MSFLLFVLFILVILSFVAFGNSIRLLLKVATKSRRTALLHHVLQNVEAFRQSTPMMVDLINSTWMSGTRIFDAMYREPRSFSGMLRNSILDVVCRHQWSSVKPILITLLQTPSMQQWLVAHRHHIVSSMVSIGASDEDALTLSTLALRDCWPQLMLLLQIMLSKRISLSDPLGNSFFVNVRLLRMWDVFSKDFYQLVHSKVLPTLMAGPIPSNTQLRVWFKSVWGYFVLQSSSVSELSPEMVHTVDSFLATHWIAICECVSNLLRAPPTWEWLQQRVSCELAKLRLPYFTFRHLSTRMPDEVLSLDSLPNSSQALPIAAELQRRGRDWSQPEQQTHLLQARLFRLKWSPPTAAASKPPSAGICLLMDIMPALFPQGAEWVKVMKMKPEETSARWFAWGFSAPPAPLQSMGDVDTLDLLFFVTRSDAHGAPRYSLHARVESHSLLAILDAYSPQIQPTHLAPPCSVPRSITDSHRDVRFQPVCISGVVILAAAVFRKRAITPELMYNAEGIQCHMITAKS